MFAASAGTSPSLLIMRRNLLLGEHTDGLPPPQQNIRTRWLISGTRSNPSLNIFYHVPFLCTFFSVFLFFNPFSSSYVTTNPYPQFLIIRLSFSACILSFTFFLLSFLHSLYLTTSLLSWISNTFISLLYSFQRQNFAYSSSSCLVWNNWWFDSIIDLSPEKSYVERMRCM